jgi:hemoglobin
MKKPGFRFLLYVSALFFLLFGPLTIAQETELPKGETLYNRLGGIHAIAQVVDDFVERIWVNEVLNANPKNKQAMGISKPALKYLATELTCQAVGGPQKYTGRSLKEVHSGLNISEKEWDAMVEDFKATLNKFNVPTKEQAELLEVIGGVKGDIVMAVEK